MAKQNTRFQSLKSIAGAAIAWLGVFGLFGNLDRVVPQFSNLLCGAVREGLALLPSVVPLAWQAMQAYAFDHHLFECLLQTLLSLWPLLHVMAGGIQ
jgi:hypothetical protein